MTHFEFKVPLYHYDITLAYITQDDLNNVKENGKYELQNKVLELTSSSTITDVVIKDVEEGNYDGAITFHNLSEHKLFTFFYPMGTLTRARECAGHELYHLTRDIVKKCNLDEEAGAYLQEYICMKLFDFVHTKISGL